MKIDRNEHYMSLNDKGYRQDIIRKLKNLLKTDGWQILMFSLEDEYESLELRLKDIEQPLSPEELQRIRTRLYYIKTIMDMPESFIKELSREQKDQAIQDDIY